jgi:hypothetical protein
MTVGDLPSTPDADRANPTVPPLLDVLSALMCVEEQ